MNILFAAAADIEAFCVVRGWRYCVIGGFAVQRWGEPRQTRVVDLEQAEPRLVALFSKHPARLT